MYSKGKKHVIYHGIVQEITFKYTVKNLSYRNVPVVKEALSTLGLVLARCV